MKIAHISDLHLGKRLNEYSMIEEQKYILKEMLDIFDKEKPNIVLIAGDVYDKSIPSTEAVEALDDFLFSLSKRDLQVFLISGNHDSSERVAFASRILNKSGIHISPVFDGFVKPITLNDEYGEINIYMLPFIKPANVRPYFENEINSYTDAISCVIKKMEIDESKRNILVTHQFVTGSKRSDSEEISVGGSDNVDSYIFDGFDYVALGHLHAPQFCTKKIRYCGSPLKYSFSESKDEKSITFIDIKEKGNLEYKYVPLVPIHDVVELKGTYEELTLLSFYKDTSYSEDYVHITLTDEDDIPNAISKLRVIYHHILKLDYDNKRTRKQMEISGASEIESKSPLELFVDFYELQNNQKMSDEQMKYVSDLIEKVWEDKT